MLTANEWLKQSPLAARRAPNAIGSIAPAAHCVAALAIPCAAVVFLLATLAVDATWRLAGPSRARATPAARQPVWTAARVRRVS